MDNILKLVLGVLGLVGLVVLLTPSGNPLADKAPVASGPVAETEAESTNTSPLPDPNIVNEENKPEGSKFAVTDHDISNFGKPMVDPTPPSERNAQQAATLEDDDRENSGPTNGYAAANPPSYVPQQPYPAAPYSAQPNLPPPVDYND